MPSLRVRSGLAIVLLALLGSALVLSTGCAPKISPEPTWEKDARTLLDQANGFFAKKQYDQALKTADTFMYQYPTSRYRDRVLYLLGDVWFAKRGYERALNYYKQLILEFPASSSILSARYRLGQCYFELKEYELAIANLADRSKVTDPAQLRRTAEMLSVAYLAKKNYLPAARELTYLALTGGNEQQKAGYRDRLREIIEKNLTEDEVKTLAADTSYPSDIALLRLAGLMIEQRQYRDAIRFGKEFLDKFPNHPEKTRAEMLINEAMTELTAPRYFIGVLIPQSGQLAFFGDHVLKGIQLAVHEYNLREPNNRAELLIKDTEGSPEKAVTALKELASKGVAAVIGPLLTKETEAIVPELDALKIPVITPAASGEEIGKLSPWLFRNALTNSSQATAAAQFALELGLKKFVILYPDDAYGKDLARLFTRNLEQKAEILANVSYPSDVKDFGPYIRRIMEIDLRARKVPIPDDDAERKKLFDDYVPGFDAMYLPGYAERVGLLIPQLAYYNIINVTMIGSNNWHSPDLIERAKRYADGAVFVDGFFPESDDPAIKPIWDSYRSAYHEEPDILSAQAYDAAAMVFSVISNHKDTPQGIRDGLLALTNYHGISGDTTFPGNGEAQKKLFLIKVQDGKFLPYSSSKE
ncbi:MAG TPA: penicillin-binding protein activator [Nitrospirota bacterium]|nr:penicillin-binding protein activator [Nitrospirota bacterium]